MTVRATLIAVLACMLGAAPVAHAKEGVVATLERPALLRDAEPGERIAVAWKLTDAAGHPFGAGEIHLRVRDAALGGWRVLPARASGAAGRYVADVTIPGRGIASIAVGLVGFRIVRGQAPVRGDMVFPVVNDPLATDPDDAGAGPPWVALAAVVPAAALAACAFAGLRRRDDEVAR